MPTQYVEDLIAVLRLVQQNYAGGSIAEVTRLRSAAFTEVAGTRTSRTTGQPVSRSAVDSDCTRMFRIDGVDHLDNLILDWLTGDDGGSRLRDHLQWESHVSPAILPAMLKEFDDLTHATAVDDPQPDPQPVRGGPERDSTATELEADGPSSSSPVRQGGGRATGAIIDDPHDLRIVNALVTEIWRRDGGLKELDDTEVRRLSRLLKWPLACYYSNPKIRNGWLGYSHNHPFKSGTYAFPNSLRGQLTFPPQGDNFTTICLVRGDQLLQVSPGLRLGHHPPCWGITCSVQPGSGRPQQRCEWGFSAAESGDQVRLLQKPDGVAFPLFAGLPQSPDALTDDQVGAVATAIADWLDSLAKLDSGLRCAGISPPLPPAPLQEEAVGMLRAFYQKHQRGRTVLSLPTDAERTKAAAQYLTEDWLSARRVVVWIADRRGLLDQAESAFRAHESRLPNGISLRISRFDERQLDLSGNVILVLMAALARDRAGKLTIGSIKRKNQDAASLGIICLEGARSSAAEKTRLAVKGRFLRHGTPLLCLDESRDASRQPRLVRFCFPRRPEC